jgi:hypothetical protein
MEASKSLGASLWQSIPGSESDAPDQLQLFNRRKVQSAASASEQTKHFISGGSSI